MSGTHAFDGTGRLDRLSRSIRSDGRSVKQTFFSSPPASLWLGTVKINHTYYLWWRSLSRCIIIDFMPEVTQLLNAIGQGDPRASADLLPLVYDELRKLAAQKLAQEKPGQTLQATALVHEAYLRLLGPAGRQILEQPRPLLRRRC